MVTDDKKKLNLLVEIRKLRNYGIELYYEVNINSTTEELKFNYEIMKAIMERKTETAKIVNVVEEILIVLKNK